MNFSTRTNQALHIGQLISQVIMPLSVLNGNTFPPADGTIRNARVNDSFASGSSTQSVPATSQNLLSLEGRDPVRSTERVPECPSNQLDREWSASSGASTAPGTTNPIFHQVEAA
jgi:hypothetical protein